MAFLLSVTVAALIIFKMTSFTIPLVLVFTVRKVIICCPFFLRYDKNL